MLDRDVPASDVVRAAARLADKALIREVSVFDVFEGGALAEEGKKSLAIEVSIQPATETLTDQAIETITQKIVADVKRSYRRRTTFLIPAGCHFERMRPI